MANVFLVVSCWCLAASVTLLGACSDSSSVASRPSAGGEPGAEHKNEGGLPARDEAMAASRRLMEFEKRLRQLVREIETPGGLFRRPSPPPILTLPAERTTDVVMPRGMAWLVAQQNRDGTWCSADESGNALANALLLSDHWLDQSWPSARRRINRRTEPPRRATPEQHVAVTLHARCRIARRYGIRRAERPQIRQLAVRLAGMQREDGTWGDGCETAWALLALRGVTGCLENPSILVLRKPPDRGPAEDAVVLALWAGFPRQSVSARLLREFKLRILNHPGRKGARLTLDGWYLRVMALPHGTPGWDRWRKTMARDVMAAQRSDGSWGSVRSTALALLCLRVAEEIVVIDEIDATK